MNTEAKINKLATDFEETRSRLKGKRLVYRQALKKRAVALLASGIHPEELSNQLGISRSAIDNWSKQFSEQSNPDFIPLEPVPESVPEIPKSTTNLKVTTVSIDVPFDQLGAALGQMLNSMGVSQ